MTTIAVIGGGTMGATFVRAVTNAGLVSMSDLTVCEVLPERRAWLEDEFSGISVTGDQAEAVNGGEVVYLSVKPQDLRSLNSAAGTEAKLLISILAGSTIADVHASTGAERIVRAMPNTPAQIGKGFTAWTATASVTDEERNLVSQLLDTMGEQLYVADESAIDKITAVSGSGPAYVFLIIEAMINAAVNYWPATRRRPTHGAANDHRLQRICGPEWPASRRTQRHGDIAGRHNCGRLACAGTTGRARRAD